MTQTTLYWVTYSFWATGLMIPQIEVFLSMKNLQSGEFFNNLQSEEETAFNSNSSDGWIIPFQNPSEWGILSVNIQSEEDLVFSSCSDSSDCRIQIPYETYKVGNVACFPSI